MHFAGRIASKRDSFRAIDFAVDQRRDFFPFLQFAALIFVSFDGQNAVLVAVDAELVEQRDNSQKGGFAAPRSFINAAHCLAVRFGGVRIDFALRFAWIRKIPIHERAHALRRGRRQHFCRDCCRK